MKKAILFDLDGTLWDSSKAVVDSWNIALERMPNNHYHMTEELMQSYMGKPMDEIAYAFFNDVSKERALELITSCTDYENEYLEERGGILYPNLENVLAKLHEEYFLAVVSNCQEGYIEAFIKYHHLETYFDDTENYGRTLLSKGENIRLLLDRNEIKEAFYLGDTMGDYESTMQAGIPFLHAAYGFGHVPEGTPKIDSFEEILEVAPTMF